MTQTIQPQRFYSLDVLRGIAALSVVLWHWQHFFLPMNKAGVAFSPRSQPLYDFFYVFYNYGERAVELFFCISGFVFFWLYSKRIADGEISFGSFSILRLSRLYPLHFATLVFVAIAQLVYISMTHGYFTYPFNDAYHFVLNLFFVSSWGFQKGYSFNYPVWSVSIEVLLYALFYVFCRIFRRNTLAVFAAIFIGHFVIYNLNHFISKGVECFYLGGLAFLVYERIIKAGDTWKVSSWLPYLVLGAWLLAILSAYYAEALEHAEMPMLLRKLASNWVVFFLFPSTILSLALVETIRGTLGKRVSFIGDLSYSSYLLHFPLQLLTAIIVTALALGQELFYSAWFMVAFYLVLIGLSLLSHSYFELPMQRFLRQRFAAKPAAAI
jgi:peptidoglycan/LPS O-acetylase OafA/YrhL